MNSEMRSEEDANLRLIVVELGSFLPDTLVHGKRHLTGRVPKKRNQSNNLRLLRPDHVWFYLPFAFSSQAKPILPHPIPICCCCSLKKIEDNRTQLISSQVQHNEEKMSISNLNQNSSKTDAFFKKNTYSRGSDRTKTHFILSAEPIPKPKCSNRNRK